VSGAVCAITGVGAALRWCRLPGTDEVPNGSLDTAAPSGGWKLKMEDAGVAKEIFLSPTLNAGTTDAVDLDLQRYRGFAPIAMVTTRTVEPVSRGRTSSGARRRLLSVLRRYRYRHHA
jgi:hypothetical protein